MDNRESRPSTTGRENTAILTVSVFIGIAVGGILIGGVWGWVLAFVIANGLAFGTQAVVSASRR